MNQPSVRQALFPIRAQARDRHPSSRYPVRVMRSAVLAVGLFCCLTQADAKPRQDLVEAGRYLAIAADCGGCHTNEPNKPFAGGKPLPSPFGTLYSSNITPDQATGIGAWTRDDFTRALRHGLNKAGDYIYPAMPYTSYTKIVDKDINALWAYMRSLKPIKATPPAHDLVFPTNLRTGLGLWQELYFEPGRFKVVAGKDAAYARGAYLVEALGHCSACHSPRNLLMAEEEGSRRLGGAEVHQWYAPDISGGPLSATSDWSVEQLATFLKTGTNNTNVTAFGEMARVIDRSLSRLTDDDVRAMAVYLKNMPASGESAEPVEPTSMPPVRYAAGRAIYGQYCLNCHQPKGKGLKGAAPALDGNSAVAAAQPDNAIVAVLQGFPADDAWGAMPSFARQLSDPEIADVVNYIRTSWSNKAKPNAGIDMVTETRESSDISAVEARQAVTCPTLASRTLKPALAASPAELKAALNDRDKLNGVVQHYTAARPDAPVRQVVNALTAAYCRVVVRENIPQTEAYGRIADFSGQVAARAATQTSRN